MARILPRRARPCEPESCLESSVAVRWHGPVYHRARGAGRGPTARSPVETPGFRPSDCPVAEQAAFHALPLPTVAASMNPVVSILIPAFNAQAYIADTIKSALGQTWLRKEIIVVDDGSRDQTLSIARKLASKEVAVVTQASTWLVGRALAQAAGPWNTQLSVDDDGEYFCRVLLASDGTRFVPEARVFYRFSGYKRLSYIGCSDHKMESQFLSIRLHIGYLRSLEESERTRQACMRYLQRWIPVFYPERLDIVRQMEQLAATLGGRLEVPLFSGKHVWIQEVVGWPLLKRLQTAKRRLRWSTARSVDRVLFLLESHGLI